MSRDDMKIKPIFNFNKSDMKERSTVGGFPYPDVLLMLAHERCIPRKRFLVNPSDSQPRIRNLGAKAPVGSPSRSQHNTSLPNALINKAMNQTASGLSTLLNDE